MDYHTCLIKHGYKPTTKYYKITDNNIVLEVKFNNIYYISKILLTNKTEDKLWLKTMNTEVQALKYFTNKLKLPFFPKYIDNFNCKNNEIIIMEKLKGKELINFKDDKLSNKLWKSLLYQLILIIYVLEDNMILHNDFWDANIFLVKTKKKELKYKYKNKDYIVNYAGFIVKVIDFQFTNQYISKPSIKSNYVMTKAKKYQEEKKRIGWSNKFHKGGDLNQILGLLSEYKYIPLHIKKLLNKIVIKREGEDFPYAIQKENKYTSAEYLLDNFDNLFKL